MKKRKSSSYSAPGHPELVVMLLRINLGKFKKTGSGRYVVSNLRKNQKASAKRMERQQSMLHLFNVNQKKGKLTEQDEATLLSKKEHMAKRRSENVRGGFNKKQKKKAEPSSKKKKSEAPISLARTNLENRLIIEEQKLQASVYRNGDSVQTGRYTGMSRRSASERKKTTYFGEWLEHAELFSRSQSQKKQYEEVEMEQETNVQVIPNVCGYAFYSRKTVAEKKKKKADFDLDAEIELIKGSSIKTVDSTKIESSTKAELFTVEKPCEGEVLLTVEKEKVPSATQESVENKILEKEEFLMNSGLKPVCKKRKPESLPEELPKPDNKQPKLLDSVFTSKCNLHRPSESPPPKPEEKQDPEIPDEEQANQRPSHEEDPEILEEKQANRRPSHEEDPEIPEEKQANRRLSHEEDPKIPEEKQSNRRPSPEEPKLLDSVFTSKSNLHRPSGSTLVESEGNCTSTTTAATPSSSRLTKLADSYYINRIIRRLHKVDLKVLHCLLFLSDARKKPIRRNILSFGGFDFGKSSREYECRKTVLRRLGESIVKRIAFIFGCTPLNSTLPLNVLINEVMEFLMNLRENEKEPKNEVLQKAHDFFKSGPSSFEKEKILKDLLLQDDDVCEIMHIKEKSVLDKFMKDDDAQITSELPIANIDENVPVTEAFSSSSGATSNKTRKTGMPCTLMTSGLQTLKQAKELQITEAQKTELCSVTHKDISEKSATATLSRDIGLLRFLEKTAKIVMTHMAEKEQTLLGFVDVDGACDKSSTEVKVCTDASPLKIKQPSTPVVKRNDHPTVETFGMHNVVSRNKQLSKSDTKINDPPNLPLTEIKDKPTVSPVKGSEHPDVETIGQHNVVSKKENNEQVSKSEAKISEPPDISSTEIKGKPSVPSATSSKCALKRISQSNVPFIKTSIQPTAKIMQLVVQQNQGKGQSTLKVNKTNGQIMIPLRIVESPPAVTLDKNTQPVTKSQHVTQISIPSVSTDNINSEVPQGSKSPVLPNLTTSQVETATPLDYNSQTVKIQPILNSSNLYVASIAGKPIPQVIQAGKSEKKQMTAPTPHRFYNIVLNQSSTSETTQQGHSQIIRLPDLTAPLSTNATLAASSASNITPVLNLKQTTVLLISEATQHKSQATNLGPKLVQFHKSATSSGLATSSITKDVSPVINSVETSLPMVQKIMAALNTAITKTGASVTPTIVQGIMPKSKQNLRFSSNNADVWNISHDIENDLAPACHIPPEVITIEDSDTSDQETEDTEYIPTRQEIFASIQDIIHLLDLEDISKENISQKLVERFPDIALSDHQEFITDSIQKIFL